MPPDIPWVYLSLSMSVSVKLIKLNLDIIMKEITEDFLKLNGFHTNHPERVIKKFYLSKTVDGCEFHVTAKQEYIVNTNKLYWNVDCWRADETGAIVKRSSVHYTNDVEELRKVMELCGIELEIKSF